jgi:uncharacterized phage infection (PIP) family protein YhgE
MRRILTILVIALTVGLSGCANLNPRNQSPIDNQNGKIDEIRNNQNGVMAEIGKLRQSNDIANSQLKEMQQGLLNLNAAVSRNENSGVQILQGDGALILVFSLAVIGMLLYWYRDRAVKSEKASEIMAKEIAKFNDPSLNDNILRAAMNSDAETHVYHMLVKHQLEH